MVKCNSFENSIEHAGGLRFFSDFSREEKAIEVVPHPPYSPRPGTSGLFPLPDHQKGARRRLHQQGHGQGGACRLVPSSVFASVFDREAKKERREG